MVLYQVCSNNASEAKNRSATGVTWAYIKSTFSEYDHVAYQIKGNEAYNNMLANILLLHLVSIYNIFLGGVKRLICFFFLEVVMLHIKLIRMKHKTPCMQLFSLFTHPRPLYGIKKSKDFFSEEDYVAYHMQLKCLTL